MFSQLKAQIHELAKNSVFVRNLSCTFIVAIASLYGLSELQSGMSVNRPDSIYSSFQLNRLHRNAGK